MPTSKPTSIRRAEKPVSLSVVKDAGATTEATPAPSGADNGPSAAHEEQNEGQQPTEQFNAHDAKALAKQIDQMLLTLAQMGLSVDQGRIKAAADAQAACEILVARGLATEAEVQARAYRAAASIVAQVLQQAEEMRLNQQRQAGQVQAVRTPGIVVARH